MSHNILLDSGTNEVELLEFLLGDQSFGINVAKVRQLVPFDPGALTAIPQSDEAGILGMYLWRGTTLPLIDISGVLKRPAGEAPARPIVLVTNFNDVTNGFLVDGVNRVHRLKWSQIDPASEFLQNFSAHITGSVHIEDKEILLIDFEYLVAEIFPETKLESQFIEKQGKAPAGSTSPLAREEAKIIYAEDSNLIRRSALKVLREAGYLQVQSFVNGREAFDHIKSLVDTIKKKGGSLSDHVHLVVTDIEMPQMDGLTLCRRIKEDLGLKELPVIVFSSLVDIQMAEKCREVGAYDFATKPQVNKIVEIMDTLIARIQSSPPAQG